MKAAQHLRPQMTNWDQIFTIWEGFGYILRFHDVLDQTASKEETLGNGGCPISQAPVYQLRPTLHHDGISKYIQNLPIWWSFGLNWSTGAWDIGQPPFTRISSLEAIWPQTSWNLKIYPKPSNMVKFWSQLINWGLRYLAASVYIFKTCFSYYSEAIAFFEVLISQVGKVFTIEMLC